MSGGSWENSLPPCLIEVSLFLHLEGCEEPSYTLLPNSIMHFLVRYFIIERRKLANTVFKMKNLKPKDIILSTSYNHIAKEDRGKMIWIHVCLFFLKLRWAVLDHEWLAVKRTAQQTCWTTAVPVHLYIQILHG